MIERRTYPLSELRADNSDNTLRISGHAAVFNQKSEELWGFREIILPGAFKKTIQTGDIRALWNHDPNFVLGRKKAGTLRLKEDETGLKTDIDLPDTQLGRDIYTSIKRGDVDQMSFGFRTINDKLRTEDKQAIRELVEVELFDVSPVTFPAYPQTDISVRSDEIRTYYQDQIQKLSVAESASDDKTKPEFLARVQARQDFINRRMPQDRLSEIIKRSRIVPIGG